MLMGQTHFVPMDFEPGWRLRLFLGRLLTGRLPIANRGKLPSISLIDCVVFASGPTWLR